MSRETDVVNPVMARERLFRHLETVLERSEKMFLYTRGKHKTRLAYGRLLVSAIDTYGRLLKLAEIDDLTKRIERIEEKLNA
jgi:hypothetical protein